MPDGTQAEAETSSARSKSGWRASGRAGGVSRRRGAGGGGGGGGRVCEAEGASGRQGTPLPSWGRVCPAGGVSWRRGLGGVSAWPGACPPTRACPGPGAQKRKGSLPRGDWAAATAKWRRGVGVQPWQRRVRGWGTQVRRLPGLGSAGSGPARDGGLGGRGLRRTPGWGPPRDGGRGLQPVRGGWASGILPVCRETQGPAPDVVCLPPDSGRMKPAAARSLLLCALCLAMCRVGGASR